MLKRCYNPSCPRPQQTRFKPKACSGCLITAYCGPECQRSHWKHSHKLDCYPGSVYRTQARALQDYVQKLRDNNRESYDELLPKVARTGDIIMVGLVPDQEGTKIIQSRPQDTVLQTHHHLRDVMYGRRKEFADGTLLCVVVCALTGAASQSATALVDYVILRARDAPRRPPLHLLEPRCGACHKPEGSAKSLSVCGGCGVLQYCDRDCQRSHWKKHKPSCRSPVFRQACELGTARQLREARTKLAASTDVQDALAVSLMHVVTVLLQEAETHSLTADGSDLRSLGERCDQAIFAWNQARFCFKQITKGSAGVIRRLTEAWVPVLLQAPLERAWLRNRAQIRRRNVREWKKLNGRQ